METSTWIVLLFLILVIIASIYYSVLTPLFFNCPMNGNCPCRSNGRRCGWRCRYCHRDDRFSNCHLTRFGCCPDGLTPRVDPTGKNCYFPNMGGCAGTRYGCCPDGVTPKRDFRGKNCFGIYL
jgi:hypothetical protein